MRLLTYETVGVYKMTHLKPSWLIKLNLQIINLFLSLIQKLNYAITNIYTQAYTDYIVKPSLSGYMTKVRYTGYIGQW